MERKGRAQRKKVNKEIKCVGMVQVVRRRKFLVRVKEGKKSNRNGEAKGKAKGKGRENPSEAAV